MKRILSSLILCFVLCVMLLGLAGCSQPISTITVWIGGSIVGEDELEQPQESWIISTLLRQYELENKVKVELTYFEDEEAMVQLIANNGRNNNEVPDIACIYSSEIARDMADVIFPLTSYISEEEKEHIMFWETVSQNGKPIAESDEILGYPIGGTEVTFIGYNKSIFADAGIDVENAPPQTFNEFYVICDTLRKRGITPIVASDGGWNELYLQVFTKKWVQFSGDDKIISMSKGTQSFSGDPFLIESIKTASEYYSNGFINHDYATNGDAPTLFANGQAAMFSCSNYDINMFQSIMGENFGAFILPDYEGDVIYPHISFGGCNQCLSVFRNSQHKDIAIQLIRWLANKENTIKMAQAYGCFPNRNDITLHEYNENPDAIIQKIYPLLPYAHSTPDYLMPMKVYSDFYRYSLSAMVGQISVDTFIEKMDVISRE